MKRFQCLTALLLCAVLLVGCGNSGGAAPAAPAPSAPPAASPTPQAAPAAAPAAAVGAGHADAHRGGGRRSPSAVPAPAPSAPPAASPTPQAAPAAAPAASAVRVRMTRADGGEGEKVLLEGLDPGGAVIWQRTETTAYRTELTLIAEIGAWRDRYYYTREGTVCCLRISDGLPLWENAEFGGASVSGLVDQRNGSVYLCGWYGPDFFACSRDGTTLSRVASASGNEFFWPSDMAWSGADRLVIYWHGGAGPDLALPYTVDLTDFSVSCDFGFEDMDAARQYWANIFISDFIEQFKSDFPTDGGSDLELARFAHLFCKINRHSALSYDGNTDTFTLETVNELCRRFFGREIHPAEGVLYENRGGLRWTYENGKFRFPSGDGESYNRFAVVASFLRLPGGNVILGYDVYEVDLDEYWKNGMDSALYRMTSAQARALEGSGRVRRLGSGWAEATPVEQNGHDGYYLRRMETAFD